MTIGPLQRLLLGAAFLMLPGSLSAQAADVEALKARFKGLDLNQDGVLSGAELAAVEMAGRDLDGDGRVTGPEFIASSAGDPVSATQGEDLPPGRYICYQNGTLYWGYVDVQTGGTYAPFAGGGGGYALDGDPPLITFQGGIFESYDWVGLWRERDTGQAEIRLIERADLVTVLAGGSRGEGSGLMIICGHSED